MMRTLIFMIALALVPMIGMAASSESKDDKAIALFNGKNFDGWTMHLRDADVDPKDVWEVRDGNIWCKGDPFGYMRTTKKYADFKLVVEWKWPDEPTNSGVLLRIQDEDKIWPVCLEAQLKHESAGDFVGMGCYFNEQEGDEGEFFTFAPRKHDSSEKEPGEWNKYEIVCQGDTVELTVNGKVQNKATGVKVLKGYIGLQSEGEAIMFRNVTLTPID